MDFVKTYLQQLSPISEAEWNLFKTFLRLQKMKKGEIFSPYNTAPDKFAFVKAGIFKTSLVLADSTKEQIKAISGPNDLIGPYADYLRKQKTNVKIEAMTKGEIVVCSFMDVERILAGSRDWEIYRRKIAETCYLLKEQKESELLTDNAAGRYEKFQLQFLAYLNDIPDYLVAEYLNISASYLSTLKKKKS